MSRDEKQRDEGDGEGGFLSRWSRRKQRDRETPAPEDGVRVEEDVPSGAVAMPASDGTGALSEEEIAALPDPDSLGAGDDFKPFLRRGVPEMLKRRALRRLWAINPLFNFRDGLNDYDEDYTDAATVVANLQTLFQPGKGMPQPERWRKPEPPQEAAAEDATVAEEVAPDDRANAEEGNDSELPEEAAVGQPQAEPVAVSSESPEPALRGTRRPVAQRRWSGFAVSGDETEKT